MDLKLSRWLHGMKSYLAISFVELVSISSVYITKLLMKEKKTNSETLRTISSLMWLITREKFIAPCFVSL